MTAPPTAAAPGAGETRDSEHADPLMALRCAIADVSGMWNDGGPSACDEADMAALESLATALAALTPEVVAEAVAYLRGHLLETGDTVRTPNADACLAVADALAALARRPGGTEVGQ